MTHEAHSLHVPHLHRQSAPEKVSAFVITCSDSRASADDASGDEIARLLLREGHTLAGRALIRDEPSEIRAALDRSLALGTRVVVITGGTGIGRRDLTVETLRPLFSKELPGFGELFRMLSFQQVGSAAMLSRATAGTVQGALVFALPGSPAAVTLAMEALILPELSHASLELAR